VSVLENEWTPESWQGRENLGGDQHSSNGRGTVEVADLYTHLARSTDEHSQCNERVRAGGRRINYVQRAFLVCVCTGEALTAGFVLLCAGSATVGD
jgi:hypothetical protein